MVGFYIYHNTSIGLECFAFGLLFGVGGLVALVFNAVQLGAVFGYMSTVPEWHVFSQFVTAHGPFELTAIALSAAAGMRLGFALIDTRRIEPARGPAAIGQRSDARHGGRDGDVCFGRPDRSVLVSERGAYAIKAAVAIASASLLFFYIVILGRQPDAAPQEAPLHAT